MKNGVDKISEDKTGTNRLVAEHGIARIIFQAPAFIGAAILFAFVFSVPSFAYTGDPEWTACQSDAQCTLAQNCDGCVAINTDYVRHAFELGPPECRADPPCDSQRISAICQMHHCILVSKDKTQ